MAIFDTPGYFSSFSFPYRQYLCEFQTSFTINQHSVIDEMLCMHLILSQLYFYKKEALEV